MRGVTSTHLAHDIPEYPTLSDYQCPAAAMQIAQADRFRQCGPDDDDRMVSNVLDVDMLLL